MVPRCSLIGLLALPLAAQTFDIPAVPVPLNIAGQPVAITVSGTVSQTNQQNLALDLHADLTDLQSHITALLQAEVDESSRCGNRIAVERGILAPAGTSAKLTVQLHFEKWACIKAFHKENATKLVGSNDIVHLLLTPHIEVGAQTIRLDADVGDIDADGTLGDLLHSEYGGPLRDKIRAALLKAIQKSSGLEAVVPEQARPFVTIQSVQFAERGTGILLLQLTGRVTVPPGKLASVLEQFQAKR